MFDIQIAYLTRKQNMMEKSNNFLLEHNSCQKNHSYVFIMSYNMRILPYLNPCCGVLTARFSNLTKFECSHRRDIITYTHDIFNNKCKTPHYVTWKISNLYIENEYHQLTLQKNSDYFWTRVYDILQLLFTSKLNMTDVVVYSECQHSFQLSHKITS